MISAGLCLGLWMVPAQAEEPDTQIINETGRGISLDEDWRFCKTDGDDMPSPAMDDREWRQIDLPHDWSIEQDWTTQGEGESGFLLGGTAWYRKRIRLGNECSGKTIQLHFDGIYHNAEIWFNGRRMAFHPNGYTGFTVDVSDEAITDGNSDNLIAVRVDNQVPSSRWYSGSGIYRNVTLNVLEHDHIQEDGVVITTPDLDSTYTSISTVDVTYTFGNGLQEQPVEIISRIEDESGRTVSSEEQMLDLKQSGTAKAEQKLQVEKPLLWSPEEPHLYTLHTEVRREDELLDSLDTPFGFRFFSFDKDQGFFLNGERYELKGVCLHHDQGALGASSYEAAFVRQLQKMKTMGANAIRFAHNPADPKMLRLCDEMGFLVIEEAFDTWSCPKNSNVNDYSTWFNQTIESWNTLSYAETGMTWAEYDIRTMVRSARNHPSIILWSIGNEILGNIYGDPSAYPEYAADLCRWVKEEDETRPCTIADNMAQKNNSLQDEMDQAVVDAGGIIGLNYVIGTDLDKVRQKHPDWTFYGSETASTLTTRGEYSTFGKDEKNYQVTAYDKEHVDWGSTAEQAWNDTITRPWLGGEFIWTGSDYIGEPEPWNGLDKGSVTNGDPIPHSSYFGAVDTAGFEKDLYYYYAAQWNTEQAVLHLLPSWEKKGVKRTFLNFTRVYVYSNSDEVELFLNGRSKGRKKPDSGIATWLVWYRPGTLEARAYDSSGKQITDTIGRSAAATSGEPAGFAVSTDRESLRPDGMDLAYVTVDVLDKDGNPVCDSDASFDLTLSGEGTLAGMDDGDPTSLERMQSEDGIHGSHRAFHGRLLVILKAGRKQGKITLTINGGSLGRQTITVPVRME